MKRREMRADWATKIAQDILWQETHQSDEYSHRVVNDDDKLVEVIAAALRSARRNAKIK